MTRNMSISFQRSLGCCASGIAAYIVSLSTRYSKFDRKPTSNLEAFHMTRSPYLPLHKSFINGLGTQVVLISVAILFMLFSFQRFGTDKGFSAQLQRHHVPSVALCYIGQAPYLRKFQDNVANTFYRSIQAPMFWPTIILAILAAIIASQAMLSGYIPEVNLLMGFASIVVTVAFRTTTSISHAYGNYTVYGFRDEHNNMYKVGLDYPWCVTSSYLSCQPVTLLGEKEKIGVVSTVRRPNMRRAEDECRREHAATEGILRCSGQRLFHDIQVMNQMEKSESK
ncbi:hypothetical protein ZWY2020_057615 [Hordeum vulgare]|nr:hypothetical protein ZWY2020_057615 [Hordeum vulgare]